MRRRSPFSRSGRAPRRPAVPASQRGAATYRPAPAGRKTLLFESDDADKLPLILFSYDLKEHRLTHCNRHCHSVLGYTSQELMAMGPELVSKLLHSDTLSQFQRSNPRLLVADGRALNWDCCLRHRNGKLRWLRIRARASVLETDGEVRELIASAEDVTNHHAAVAELRQKRFLLRRIINIVPNLIYILDLRHEQNLYCNRRVEKLLGFTPEEIKNIGSQLIDFLIPAEQTHLFRTSIAEVASLADGETLEIEYAARHRDGSLRWLRTTHTPFERDDEGRVISVMGISEDVTKRRVALRRDQAAAQRLAEQYRLFREVIDALPHPIYLKDGNGNYLLANRALSQLYGLSPDELVSRGLASLSNSSEEIDRYLAQDRQVLAAHRDLTLEESYTMPDGETLWFSSVKKLFVLADGTERVLGIDSNITELKRTQLALEKAIATAEDNARVKEDFLANMSHEIRTPLHGIIGLTNVLAKTTLSSSQHDYLRLLGESAEHLLSVLNDVLTTARLGAGKLQVEATPFTPRELLMGVAALLRPRAREKNLRLRVEAGDFPAVLGDAHRLRQVLLNLVNNAIKFTEKGSVRLRCQSVPAPPDGPANTMWLKFMVTDTGIGIAPEALPEVFKPFTQAAASTDREYGGTGLGLSISHGLIELLGGELEVSSVVGKGSTFCFTLAFPLEPAKATVVAAPPIPTSYPQFNAGRVLLVEDNLVNSLLAETILRNWGWQVTAVASGPAAIQVFAHRPFDVVLMDIQMPGMDGETTAQALRQHPDAARAATPIIALTARAQPGEAERLQAVGFAGYLSKPYREEQLMEILQTVTIPQAEEPLPTYFPDPAMTSTPLYNLSNVRQLVRNDETVVRRLAWAFIETSPAILTALDEALAKSDWVAVGDAAHHLKSSLDGLGVDSLRQTIREVEDYGTTPPADAQRATQQIEQIRAVTERVMAGLREEFPEQA